MAVIAQEPVIRDPMRRRVKSSNPRGYIDTTETHQVGSTTVDKRLIYKWSDIEDCPGEFRMVHKNDLHVDSSYQRQSVSGKRVAHITSQWSWLACGCLLVVQRQDGTLWVYEGQTRKRGADRRSDITVLPCLVFKLDRLAKEAQAFISANTVRGPVSMLDRFRAMLIANDPTALKIQELLEEWEIIASSANSRGTTRALEALLSCAKNNMPILQNIFGLIVSLSEVGNMPIKADLIKGLFYLESYMQREKLGTIAEGEYRERLALAGPEILEKLMRETRNWYRRGGPKVLAQACIRVLNNNKRGKSRIPDIVVE